MGSMTYTATKRCSEKSRVDRWVNKTSDLDKKVVSFNHDDKGSLT